MNSLIGGSPSRHFLPLVLAALESQNQDCPAHIKTLYVRVIAISLHSLFFRVTAICFIHTRVNNTHVEIGKNTRVM